MSSRASSRSRSVSCRPVLRRKVCRGFRGGRMGGLPGRGGRRMRATPLWSPIGLQNRRGIAAALSWLHSLPATVCISSNRSPCHPSRNRTVGSWTFATNTCNC
eukprot:355368-Chlamydomonas_euryale.AAC.20